MAVDPWENFHRFIDAVGILTHETHFRRSLRILADSLGFDFYAYINIRSNNGFALSNYPKEWQDRYFRLSYRRLDPVIEAAKRKKVPFAWSLRDRQFLTRERREFAREANEFGISSGASIPIPAGFGHMAMLTFASSKTDRGSHELLDHLPAITAACLTHAFITVRRLHPSASSYVTLAPQEAICLRWAAEGKSMHESAALLAIKYTSVRSYLDHAREKLGAVSVTQAVAIATRLNLI